MFKYINFLLLAILLLIFSCDEELKPVIEGCTIETTCNYNADATDNDDSCVFNQGCNKWCNGDEGGPLKFDCSDVCGGNKVEDNCGTCDNDSSNDCVPDCTIVEHDFNGNWVENEDCSSDGNCCWGGSKEEDCAGACGGDAISEDECFITDIDGNIYETVGIGNQVWMAENLRSTRYNNGSEIDYLPDNTQWMNATTGAYYPPNGQFALTDDYGLLYNHIAINDSRGLCMEGWHVPTIEEWLILIEYIGGDGCILKSTGTIEDGDGLWHSPNTGAMNTYGFSANPAGVRQGDDALFVELGNLSYFWSITDSDEIAVKLSHNTININSNHNGLGHDGFSVRCIKD